MKLGVVQLDKIYNNLKIVIILLNGKQPNKKEENIRYCIECGSKIGQFLLPLYNYDNKFC